MTKGVTLDVQEWNGETGQCEKNHVVEIQKNGFGFCVECAKEESGYSTLYKLPKNYQMPGTPLSDE
tara:strand:+ start:4180 stop:4377 length:198 start_codon:yes stop_codon:yes gene_type:complete